MEQWTHWEPITGLRGRFYIKNLGMSHEGLVVDLSAEQNDIKIEISFGPSIHAYRCTNESWCFTIFSDLSHLYGGSFYNNSSFFKILNSNYAKSLSPLSAGISDSENFDHFCIVDNDFVLDVLTLDTPIVKIVKR